MERKTFIYGGYTFEPKGQFKDYGIKPGKNEFRNICSKLNNSNFGYVADGDEPFDYDEFYKAAGGCDDDVFLCKENGILYVPCAKSLQIFTPEPHEYGSVTEAYNRRRAAIEEHKEFVKKEALKDAMYFTEEQHAALIELSHAVKKCKDLGLQFSHDGDYVFVFRADLLADLTSDMVPMEGQTRIPDECYQTAIYGVWDSCDGLYANAK